MTAGGGMGVVLVVDDEAAIRLLCRVNLELGGYEVREAASLRQARAAVDEGDIDVVLLDMHVGPQRSDGFLGELREREVPVAVVTGSADLDAFTDLADAVLPKPFTIEELEATVERLAAQRR